MFNLLLTTLGLILVKEESQPMERTLGGVLTGIGLSRLLANVVPNED